MSHSSAYLFVAALAVTPSFSLGAAERTGRVASVTASRPTNRLADETRWLSAPCLGLVAVEARTELRAILGVPGSSLVSGPLSLPTGSAKIHLAPGQAWALVQREGSGPLAVLSFDRNLVEALADVDLPADAIDLIAFSPRGARSVILSRAAGRIRVVAFDGRTASVESERELTGIDPEQITAVAIDDAGQGPVAFLRDGSGYLLSREKAPQLVFRGGRVSSAVYIPGRDVLIVGDETQGQVVLVEDVRGAAAVRLLFGTGAEPAGDWLLSPSRDGQFAFIAQTGGSTVWKVEVATSITSAVPLPIPARTLQRLRNGNSYLLSALPGEAAWMLLGDEPEMRTLFAPTGPSGTGQPENAEIPPQE